MEKKPRDETRTKAGSASKKRTVGEFNEKCEVCGEMAPSYDIINLGDGEKYRRHCTRCYNQVISEMAELDFQHPDFEPVILRDLDGIPHEFHFRTQIIGSGISLEALEIKDGEPAGYEFQIMGDLEADPLELFGQLFERVRRALSIKHIKTGEYGLEICEEGVVRARIDSDIGRHERTPLLVIDGKPVSWEEFGRMLMTYEGRNFKMEIFDRSEIK